MRGGKVAGSGRKKKQTDDKLKGFSVRLMLKDKVDLETLSLFEKKTVSELVRSILKKYIDSEKRKRKLD
jgi:hypothetical protein